MQIERVETRAAVVSLRRPVKTASGMVDRAPLVLIDLLTTDGVVGRSYVFSYFPWALKALEDLVTSLGEMIEGDGVAPMRISEKLRARVTLIGNRALWGWPSPDWTWRPGTHWPGPSRGPSARQAPRGFRGSDPGL